MFIIKFKKSEETHSFNSPEEICDFLERKGYDEKFTMMGIPISIEVEGWCEIATFDEEIELNDFIVSCCDDDS